MVWFLCAPEIIQRWKGGQLNLRFVRRKDWEISVGLTEAFGLDCAEKRVKEMDGSCPFRIDRTTKEKNQCDDDEDGIGRCGRSGMDEGWFVNELKNWWCRSTKRNIDGTKFMALVIDHGVVLVESASPRVVLSTFISWAMSWVKGAIDHGEVIMWWILSLKTMVTKHLSIECL